MHWALAITGLGIIFWTLHICSVFLESSPTMILPLWVSLQGWFKEDSFQDSTKPIGYLAGWTMRTCVIEDSITWERPLSRQNQEKGREARADHAGVGWSGSSWWTPHWKTQKMCRRKVPLMNVGGQETGCANILSGFRAERGKCLVPKWPRRGWVSLSPSSPLCKERETERERERTHLIQRAANESPLDSITWRKLTNINLTKPISHIYYFF